MNLIFLSLLEVNMTLVLITTILAASLATFSLYTLFTIRFRKGSQLADIPDSSLPMVSILKPMKNIDDEIEKNLESMFTIDYPRFEILFGVDKFTDPINGIIKRLQAKYPGVAARVIQTGHNSIENPKVHKLAIMADVSEGKLFWVNDSNVRSSKDTLRKLVQEYLLNDSRIVFSPIRAGGSRSIGSIIENAYINHFLSGSVISAWKLARQQIIVGKSMLLEKSSLNRFGGFRYFKDYLAEDYMMGETYTISKIPISTNCTWVTNINQSTTIKGFFNRMARWAKLRYNIKFHFYVLEILLNPIMLALLSIPLLGPSKGLTVLLFTAALKTLLEYANFFLINESDRRNALIFLGFPFLMIFKDVLLFLVYFTPFFSRTVNWRGGKIRIGKDTLIAHSQENLLFDGV